MWISTETGFVSAVCTTHESNEVKVRARDFKSLQSLIEAFQVEVIKTPRADYPYRVIITKEQFGEFLMDSLSLMDYTNFKSRIYSSRGSEFTHASSSVWSTMNDVEDDHARI